MNKFADETDNFEGKSLKYWSNFYAKEADKYQNVLRNFGFEKSDLLLSETVNRRFNALLTIIQQLQTEEAIDDRFSHLKVIQQLILKNFKLENELLEWNEKKTSINENVLRLNLFKESLLKDSKELVDRSASEAVELQKLNDGLKFIHSKLDKYRKQIDEYEVQGLKNIEKSKKHEIIASDYEGLKESKKKLSEVKTALQIYDDLPPNTSLARAKLDEMNRQVEQTDLEIDKLMGLMILNH